MNTFSITDMGRVRSSNQDCVLCEENAIGSFPNLFIVADGMGGHRAGDTASRMCIDIVAESICSTDKKTPVSAFEEAISAANRAIYDESGRHTELSGMGTTMVAAMVEENTAVIVNIGDSRFYHMRDELRQITVDHSLVEEMVKSGEIHKEEMRTHPNKNIITRALGTDTSVRPDCFEIGVREGDVLLLCSDGLNNMLEDNQIRKILQEHRGYIEQAGRELIRRANEAGGRDNISVILIEV